MFKTFGMRSTFGFDRLFTSKIQTDLSSKKARSHSENDEVSLISLKKNKAIDKVAKARDKKILDKREKPIKKRTNTYDVDETEKNVVKRARGEKNNESPCKKKAKINLDVFAELFDSNSQDEQ
jgi:hypothetical protein